MTSSNDKGARQTGGRPSRGAGTSIKAVRGTRDLLPDQTPLWNRVEATARALFARYGFGEIRTPVFEATELFARGVGEETDIVSKEMFTWEDRERFDVQRIKMAKLGLMGALRYFEVQEDVNFEGIRLDLVARRAGQVDGKYTQIVELVEFKAE